MHQSLLFDRKKHNMIFGQYSAIVIDNASKSSRSVRSLASRKATQRKQVAPEEASQPNGTQRGVAQSSGGDYRETEQKLATAPPASRPPPAATESLSCGLCHGLEWFTYSVCSAFAQLSFYGKRPH